MQYTTGQNGTSQSMINLCHLLCRQKMVGIELASKLTTIKWQKKLQFTITQYNTEQNNIIQIFEVSLMPIMAEYRT